MQNHPMGKPDFNWEIPLSLKDDKGRRLDRLFSLAYLIFSHTFNNPHPLGLTEALSIKRCLSATSSRPLIGGSPIGYFMYTG